MALTAAFTRCAMAFIWHCRCFTAERMSWCGRDDWWKGMVLSLPAVNLRNGAARRTDDVDVIAGSLLVPHHAARAFGAAYG